MSLSVSLTNRLARCPRKNIWRSFS